MAPSLPIAWITHAACARHMIAPGHPESPQRLAAIEARIAQSRAAAHLQRFEAPEADKAALLAVHESAHVAEVLAQRRLGPRRVEIDADTAYTEHTTAAALRAAGAGLLGVDLLLRGATELAFCAVRPPGHHAERDRAMGFCYLNNVAIAAAHALASGLQRVAILDFDLHYGNGSADCFRADPRVLLLSTYQHPLYPYWPGAPEARHLVDVPLAAYSDSAAFRAAVSAQWLPALARHRPELLLVSAGFDAHAADPLGELQLDDDDYYWLGRVIREAARDSAQNRVLATLEGGYALEALARSVEQFVLAFIDD